MKTASIIILLGGLGLLVVSLLADVLGIGDSADFGQQQVLGTVGGAIVVVIGLFLMLRKK